MATHTSAELESAFDCNIGGDGLTEFDPEPQRDPDRLWLRDEHPNTVDARPYEPVVVRAEPRRWPLIAGAVIAVAVVAGGAVSWFGMRSRVATLPPPPAPAAVSSAQSAPVVPVPLASTPAPAPVPEQPAPAVVRPTTPALVTAEPNRVASSAERRALTPALDRTLARVSDAYRRLDASALSGVWPGADTASLSRAFAGLKYQSLSFDHCTVRPSGPTGALALCDVSLAKASNDGDPSLQRRHESWTLILDRSGDPWTIAGVSVR